MARARIVLEKRLGVREPGEVLFLFLREKVSSPQNLSVTGMMTIYEVELAVPGESRGTGCIAGRSRELSGCGAGCGTSAGVP